MAEYENKALGWDEEVEMGEGGDFILLPPGDYDFTVETFERARFEGSAKAPACNLSLIHIYPCSFINC